MYVTYCNAPDCPGHIRNWERCDDLRAFGRANCNQCGLGAACPNAHKGCPGVRSLAFDHTPPATPGRGRRV